MQYLTFSFLPPLNLTFFPFFLFCKKIYTTCLSLSPLLFFFERSIAESVKNKESKALKIIWLKNICEKGPFHL